MVVPALVKLLAGFVVLAYTARCWSGRSRGWVRRDARTEQLVLGCLPSLTAVLVALGIADLAGEGPVTNTFVALMLLAVLVSVTATVSGARWWGPRWYRELQRDLRQEEQRKIEVQRQRESEARARSPLPRG